MIATLQLQNKLNNKVRGDISVLNTQRRLVSPRMANFFATLAAVLLHFVLIDHCLKQSRAAQTVTQKHIRGKDGHTHRAPSQI